jgi:hypothetical protein
MAIWPGHDDLTEGQAIPDQLAGPGRGRSEQQIASVRFGYSAPAY